MYMHLIKMIWNRKRANGLIIAEVAIAFVVIFAVAVLSIRNYNLMQIPLGFEYDNMWRLQVMKSGAWDGSTDGETFQQIVAAVEQLPEVDNLSLLSNATFRNWTSTRSFQVDDKFVFYYMNFFDDRAANNFDMTLLEGRWFGPQDSNQNYDAVLVNKTFVEKFYPNGDVLGKNIVKIDPDEIDREQTEQIVVGVFDDFRQFGELVPQSPYVFFRVDAEQNKRNLGIEISLNPNVDEVFEQRLLTMLRGLAPEYSYSFTSWANSRDSQLRQTTTPLAIFGVIAAFLILMVAMGLFGVLWQNVSTRTHEIGLRRALGASASGIHRQIMSELIIVTLIGVLIAFIGLVQLPVLGVFQELDWSLFWLSFIAALVFMVSLSALCAFYPGKVATGYSPSEALHYE
ncbi:ABC transporter permease [Glaciecola petra]|uniref:FtsX-like permease family protein n=1 Tax=Glaciecola petra TaxID=3075602 RepID=A0ABU2ZVD0_9ALTE|nr:FtsX-like permease family protein [Aestuariibacter sp. P117]MDT0596360.1 FtsX-like permease family protein [Aestuariibacter sp. P117]